MRLREFRADENAVAAIELAIVLPFMLLLCMGGVELGNALSINVKVTATVHTIADILSQNKCVTTSDVTGILNASAKVLSPYDITKAVVTVSEVQPTGDNVTAKVVWINEEVGPRVAHLPPGFGLKIQRMRFRDRMEILRVLGEIGARAKRARPSAQPAA